MKAFLWLLVVIPATVFAGCSGKIINPVTDVCWSCLFPIRAAGVTVKASSVAAPTTDAPAVCTCGAGVNLRAGINLSFFEPLRTAEIVREPYCFPSLGGVTINPGVRAAAHGRSASESADETHRGTAFYEVHWYHTPWLFVLEMLLDSACLEESPWDLAYLTELDPLWDDSAAAFILAPESALFANPVAVAACAADCGAAMVGTGVTELFWCGLPGKSVPVVGLDGVAPFPLGGVAPSHEPHGGEARARRAAVGGLRQTRSVRPLL